MFGFCIYISSFACHFIRRWLYFSIYPTRSSIRRSSLNGTGPQEVVDVKEEQVTGLSIGISSRKFNFERRKLSM